MRTGQSGVPANSASMALRMASIRAPFSGWKYLDDTQKVSVT